MRNISNLFQLSSIFESLAFARLIHTLEQWERKTTRGKCCGGYKALLREVTTGEGTWYHILNSNILNWGKQLTYSYTFYYADILYSLYKIDNPSTSSQCLTLNTRSDSTDKDGQGTRETVDMYILSHIHSIYSSSYLLGTQLFGPNLQHCKQLHQQRCVERHKLHIAAHKTDNCCCIHNQVLLWEHISLKFWGSILTCRSCVNLHISHIVITSWFPWQSKSVGFLVETMQGCDFHGQLKCTEFSKVTI